MKYGIMEYSLSHNLGDEIQSIAARQFMPVQNIGDLCYPDRDKLKYFSYSEPDGTRMMQRGGLRLKI